MTSGRVDMRRQLLSLWSVVCGLYSRKQQVNSSLCVFGFSAVCAIHKTLNVVALQRDINTAG